MSQSFDRDRLDALAWRSFPVLAIVALMWPAWLNRYPLMFYDAGDYLALSLVQEPLEFRALPYALLIRVLHWEWSAWPIIWFQAFLVAWVLREAIAAFCPRRRGAVGLAAALFLGLGTSLPWITAQVMPDFLVGVMVLAMAASMLSGLPDWRRYLLAAIAALGVACHASHALVGLIVIGVAVIFCRRVVSGKWLAVGAAAVAIGIAAVPITNFLTGGDFHYSKGGRMFLLARLVQDGVVKKYLDSVCPDPHYKLCFYKDKLPATHNDFLWHERDAFTAMGGWIYGQEEADRVLWGSVKAFPLTIIATGFASGAKQLVTLRTGEGLASLNDFVLEAVDLVLPAEYEDLASSHQRRKQLSFGALNDFLHVPLAALAQIGLILALALGWRRLPPGPRHFGLLAVVGLLANALVCGALSNPTDRYQARIVWLAVLACTILIPQLRRPAAIAPGRSGTDTP